MNINPSSVPRHVFAGYDIYIYTCDVIRVDRTGDVTNTGFNTGPTSQTTGQHYTDIVLTAGELYWKSSSRLVLTLQLLIAVLD